MTAQGTTIPKQWLDSLSTTGDYPFVRQTQQSTLSAWLQQLWWEIIDAIARPGESGSVASILVYVGLVAVAVVVLYLYMKEDRAAIVARRSKAFADGHIDETSLAPVEYDRRIGEAVAAGNYRLAIRYLYLQALHVLADHDRITLRSGATNREYEQALAGTDIAAPFRVARRRFEDVWYGNHEIDPTTFEQSRDLFLRLHTMVKRA